MNFWQVFPRIMAGICVAVALAILYYSYIAFYYSYDAFGLEDVATGVLAALGIYLLARGLWLRKRLALWVWFLTIPVSFPASFVLLYGAFDGGPPIGAPPNWVLFLEATSPIPFSIITSALLYLAYKKFPGTVTEKA